MTQSLIDNIALANFSLDIGRDNGEPPLIVAAMESHEKDFDILISSGADINIRSSSGATSLMFAARNGMVNSVRLLLHCGADINAQDETDKRTALIFAAIAKQENIIQVLVAAGAKINLSDKDGKTALMHATANGCERGALTLLTTTAEKSNLGFSEGGKTLLHVATEKCLAALARELLYAGVPIDAKDEEDKTALMLAAEQGQLDTFELLSAQGSDPTLVDKEGNNALMLAAKNGACEIVQRLCESDKSEVLLSARNAKGMTAIMLAAAGKKIEEPITVSAGVSLDLEKTTVNGGADAVDSLSTTVKGVTESIGSTEKTVVRGVSDHEGVLAVLIKKGAKLEDRDFSQKTALMTAIESGRVDLATALVDSGASTKTPLADGSSLLSFAAQCNQEDIIGLLMEKGVTPSELDLKIPLVAKVVNAEKKPAASSAKINISARNSLGQTPLIVASSKGMTKMVQDLLAMGSNPDVKDFQGNTALLMAVTAKSLECVEALMQSKANIDLKSEEGHTPVFSAIASDQPKIAELLLAHGANPNTKFKGISLLMAASAKGQVDVVKRLIAMEADRQAKDFSGRLAEDYARANKHQEIIQILTVDSAQQAENSSPKKRNPRK